MAITIDWPAGIINVGRNDLPIVQSTPVEIRNLDILSFYRTLRDFEDDPEGRSSPRILDFDAEAVLSGLPLGARVIITDAYTVTFEDGFWQVNLVGANSNIADRVNPNSVGVRSQNSAGLVNLTQLEELWQKHGLDIDNPVEADETELTVGSRIRLVFETLTGGRRRMTRQP